MAGLNFLKRLSAAALVLLALAACLPTVRAASGMEVSGSADVVITALSTSHSTGAAAGAARDGNCKAILEATLPAPGAWASFTLTVQNRGTRAATLSRVLQQDDTPDKILVSFGISDTDTGETLAPGETCSITIVAQVDPAVRAAVLDENGSFALTLVYNAAGENAGTGGSPQTGDRFPLLPLSALAALSLICFVLLRRRVK